MIYIQKNYPPKEIAEEVIKIKKSEDWEKAKESVPASTRELFDRLNKQIIRDELVKEQHGLCAYCMKRIVADDKMSIEHYLPINGHKMEALEYSNMLGCCSGGRNELDKTPGVARVLCCDASKEDQEITIDPRNRVMMSKIRYSKNGRIYVDSDDPKLQYDIDNVLQLNGKLGKDGSLERDTSTQVVEGRRVAYRNYVRLMSELQKKYSKNESGIRTCLKKRIDEIEAMDIYPEFAGVMLYFMKRRIREASAKV